MPYKSRSQQRLFHYLASKGKISPETVHEYDQATDFKGLPEQMYEGGVATDDEDHEMDEYNWHRRNSSGEPHTNDKFDDEQDMEYMSDGGLVEKEMRMARMAKGGEVEHLSPLHKFLRKKMADGGSVPQPPPPPPDPTTFEAAFRKAMKYSKGGMAKRRY